MAIGFGASKGAGSNDRIAGPVETIPAQFSFHVWTNRNGDGAGTGGRIFERNSHTFTFMNDIGSGNKCAFGDRSGGSGVHFLWSRPSAGMWAPIGISVDTTSPANNPIVYQSGDKLTVGAGLTKAGSTAYASGSSTWNIGNISGGGRAWDGSLAEIAWWNVILTDAEFRMLQQGADPRTIRPGALMHYLPMVGDARRDMIGPRLSATGTKGFLPHPHYVKRKTTAKRLLAVSSGGSAQELTPAAADATASASVSNLTAGIVSLAPLSAPASAELSSVALTAGAANIDSSAAIATAEASAPDLTTDGSVLTPQVAISTAGVDNPSLTAGSVSLAPSVATASAVANDPSITNGAQLSPTAPSASAVASTPTLSAGATSVNVGAAVASANAESAALTAGGAQLSATAAIAIAVASVPEITSGMTLNSAPAIASAGADSPSFVAGLANIVAISAEGSVAASTPIFSVGQTSLLPLAAIAASIVEDAFFVDGGLQWHSEMLYSIPAEDRSFTISAENRAYSVPAV